MISYKDALKIILSNTRSFGTEKLLLDDSFNRILAEKIFADRDYPPFNRATMDGYAIKFSDWKDNVKQFVVTETIYAGKVSNKKISKGQCYKIMTGASVPGDADVVIRREDAEEKDGVVSINIADIAAFQNIAKQGQDLHQGEQVMNKPIKINAATVALLASLGKNEVMVESLPTVAIITTGDEIVPITNKVNAVQIRNSNGHLLKALLKQHTIKPISCEHIADDKMQLEQAISNAMNADIIILNGGVSAGDADHVPGILEKLGAKNIFHKVAIRPGKPIWFGKFENGATIFALPGNPFSCMVTFKIFIEPFLLRSFNCDLPTNINLPLKNGKEKRSTLDEFFPVRISGNPSIVTSMHFNTSGDITAAMEADAIAMHPADKLVLNENDIVTCRLI